MDYYVKEGQNFWVETFEKFQEKKGFSQAIDFASLNQKDQSKISERFSEVNKVS
jgi:hypothetical protein